jgi:hypothetical protein
VAVCGERTFEADASRCAREDQLRRVIRVSQRIVESDETAERPAEDDRPLDREYIGQRPHVACPLVEIPPLPPPVFAAAIPCGRSRRLCAISVSNAYIALNGVWLKPGPP